MKRSILHFMRHFRENTIFPLLTLCSLKSDLEGRQLILPFICEVFRVYNPFLIATRYYPKIISSRFHTRRRSSATNPAAFTKRHLFVNPALMDSKSYVALLTNLYNLYAKNLSRLCKYRSYYPFLQRILQSPQKKIIVSVR